MRGPHDQTIAIRPLPIPKSDSGDTRLTWSPPAVPFTAAVGCVDLCAIGELPIPAVDSSAVSPPLSADLRNPRGPLVACSSSTVFRMRSESSERCLLGRQLILCLLLPEKSGLFPGSGERSPGNLGLIVRLLADLSGSGGSEAARAASHSLADTVRCLGARAAPEVEVCLGLC